MISHLDVYMLVRVCKCTMASGLLHKLTAVGEDEGLRGIVERGNTVDQVGEDDLVGD